MARGTVAKGISALLIASVTLRFTTDVHAHTLHSVLSAFADVMLARACPRHLMRLSPDLLLGMCGRVSRRHVFCCLVPRRMLIKLFWIRCAKSCNWSQVAMVRQTQNFQRDSSLSSSPSSLEAQSQVDHAV